MKTMRTTFAAYPLPPACLPVHETCLSLRRTLLTFLQLHRKSQGFFLALNYCFNTKLWVEVALALPEGVLGETHIIT